MKEGINTFFIENILSLIKKGYLDVKENINDRDSRKYICFPTLKLEKVILDDYEKWKDNAINTAQQALSAGMRPVNYSEIISYNDYENIRFDFTVDMKYGLLYEKRKVIKLEAQEPYINKLTTIALDMAISTLIYNK